jgi:hypothetical protein
VTTGIEAEMSIWLLSWWVSVASSRSVLADIYLTVWRSACEMNDSSALILVRSSHELACGQRLDTVGTWIRSLTCSTSAVSAVR